MVRPGTGGRTVIHGRCDKALWRRADRARERHVGTNQVCRRRPAARFLLGLLNSLFLVGLLLPALTRLLTGLLLAGILLLLPRIALTLPRLLLLPRVLLLLAGIGRLIAGLVGVVTLIHGKPFSIAGATTLRRQGRYASRCRR